LINHIFTMGGGKTLKKNTTKLMLGSRDREKFKGGGKGGKAKAQIEDT